MAYCIHCGHENGEAEFCENCGKPVNSEEKTSSPSQTEVQSSATRTKKKPMSRKGKFIIMACAVLIGVIVIANIVITKMFDPMKQIKAMDAAVNEQNYDLFLEQFQLPKGTNYDAESFFLYVKEVGWSTIRDGLIEQAAHLENGEFANPVEDSYGTELVTVTQKELLFGLFKETEFKLIPIEVYADAPFKDLEIIINDHKVKANQEGSLLLGQYLPGFYEWSYTYDGQWASIKNSGELTVRGYGANEIEADVDWNATSVELESNVENAIVYVNGKSTEMTVAEIGSMYPLPADESVELYAVTENSNGEEIQSNTVTSDSRYAYFTFPVENSAATEREPVSEASEKHKYIQLLDKVEADMKDLDYLYASEDNADIIKAEKEKYQRWDEPLNEIYDVLKQQLSSSEMESLKELQLEWIEDKEETAANAASAYSDEEMKEIVNMRIQAQLTKERCYELVEDYM